MHVITDTAKCLYNCRITEEHEQIVVTHSKTTDKQNIIKLLPQRMTYHEGDKRIQIALSDLKL